MKQVFLLLSANNMDADISVNSYATHEEAHKAMISEAEEHIHTVAAEYDDVDFPENASIEDICEELAIVYHTDQDYASVLDQSDDLVYWNIKLYPES